MFVSARMNGRDAFLESARRNDRPLPAVDARSKTKAGETLEQALERGMVDQGLYWQNNADASGYAAGGVTVLATGRTDDDRVCHEVLIEIAMESRPTDQRVRTYCRGNRGWSAVATHPGEGARLPSTTPSGPNGSCACVWVKTPPHGSGSLGRTGVGEPRSRALMVSLTVAYAGRAPRLLRASSWARATRSGGLVRFIRAPGWSMGWPRVVSGFSGVCSSPTPPITFCRR